MILELVYLIKYRRDYEECLVKLGRKNRKKCLNKIGLEERTYHCDCGYSFDRDIHAAKNVKLFGSTKRAECLEQASVETLASAALDLSDVSKLSRRSENEDSSL